MSNNKKENPSQANMPFEMWNKLIEDQLTKLQSSYEELGRYHKQSVEHANQAIDELARLMKESLAQSSLVTAEWQKMALETTRQAGEMMTGAFDYSTR